MVRGEKICCIAQTEPGAGSDVAGVQTMATRAADGGWVLHGTKRFITEALLWRSRGGGRHHGSDQGAGGDRAVPRGDGGAGLRARGRGASRRDARPRDGELVVRRVPVPASALLVPPGAGFRRAMISLDSGRIGIGAQALGIAQAAMEAAIRYAQERSAFGQPIAGFQAIQFMLADMSAAIEARGSSSGGPPSSSDQGRPIIREAAEAKLVATDVAQRVVTDALQIHGAAGYSTEFPLERLYRDVRVYQIWEGTSQIQRLVISRQLLK